VEGATLLLGAAACLLVSLGPLWVRAPSLGLALLLGLMLSGMEGFLTGELSLSECTLFVCIALSSELFAVQVTSYVSSADAQ
jgi:alpha-D-ribose 1-methylphosphonate 5-triphosphate synthase subunit PhnG